MNELANYKSEASFREKIIRNLKIEIDTLKVENDTLRKKLKELEAFEEDY